MTKAKKETTTKAKTPKGKEPNRVEAIRTAIASVKENLDKLEAEIEAGKAENMSIFCVIGNESADRIGTVISGTNKDIRLTLAHALRNKPDLMETINDAVFMALMAGE